MKSAYWRESSAGKPADIADARKWITEMARTATPAVQLKVIQEDPEDDRILECAIAAGADYIVSGDNDLLRLGQYDGIPIVNPSDFLTLFQSRADGQ